MSEVHIRINKRVLERTVFLLIIIGLAIFAFSSQPSSEVSSEELTTLQEQVQNLTAQNQELQEEVSSLQATNEQLSQENEEMQAEPEPKTTPEPETTEPELSGNLEFEWSVEMDGDSLDFVVFTVNNGRDRSEDISWKLTWDTLNEDIIYESGDIYLPSGDRERVTIDDFLSNPGENVDTLELEFTDSDGDILEKLEQEVR